jgi:hypothetical protein
MLKIPFAEWTFYGMLEMHLGKLHRCENNVETIDYICIHNG